MVIAGDTDQSDIGRASGLQPWVDSLKNTQGIGIIEFTEEDVVRHPLVRTILKKQPKPK
jgi:phosphate starvation-inducible PhoH-like protein